MILTVHNLAKTYKLLPSEALERGTTFDLYVLDIFSKHQRYCQAIAEGKAVKKNKDHPSEAEMLEMIKSVRSG